MPSNPTPPRTPFASPSPSPASASRFTSDPHDPDRERQELSLAAMPGTVSIARRFVVAQLRKWGLERFTDDVEIVASEIVTNAVREVGLDAVPDGYAVSRGAHPPLIWVQLRWTAHRLLCEVWDPSPLPPVETRAAAFDEGGRGMTLITALATRWAFYPSPVGGKVVVAWWELAQ